MAKGISVHAFEFSWAESLLARHMGYLGANIDVGVNAGARGRTEMSQ